LLRSVADETGNTDSWDDMRSRTWDNPDASLEGLLASLGAARKPVAEQQAALKNWLHSAAARPAPAKLLSAVRRFLAVSDGL
jgi:hypothetical protein